MEAKEMVIKLKAVPKQIFEGKVDTIDTKLAYLAGWKDGTERQAPLSFKAGIREVVEFLDFRVVPNLRTNKTVDEWQAQLKRWNIKEKENASKDS